MDRAKIRSGSIRPQRSGHMRFFATLLVSSSIFNQLSLSNAFTITRNIPARRAGSQLAAEKKLGQKQGVYSRPSAAIERGSGFFFPGLEGPKIRLASGAAILVAVGVNHIISADHTTPLEGLAVVYSLLVLLQGVVQFQRENRLLGNVSDSLESSPERAIAYQLVWSVPVQDTAWREKVEWAAQTLTSLTVCSHLILLSPEAVIFSWGRTPIEKNDQLRSAAMSTLATSTSGRVSLPADHPVVSYLDPNFRTTVILQRCGPGMCWILASDWDLASYSPSDLKWMGRMGEYTSLEN